METSTVWFKQHPEVDIVSRDRGKLFRVAASAGAPQARHIVDRFHLQKNFAEALEKFFRPKTRVLKTAARNAAGTARPAPRAKVPHKAEQERRRRHHQRVAVYKQVWKLFREGYHKEQIAQLVGVSSRSVYRALEQQEAPSPRRRSRSHSVVDPYLAYLTERWNQGCHSGGRLYEEILTQGYPGSRRTLERQLHAFRPHGSHVVTKQVITLGKAPSARGTALMAVRPAHNRTKEQTAYLAHLTQSDSTVTLVLTLAQDFGHLLRKREGKLRLEQWQSAVRASGIAELIEFVDGLTDDAEAVANGYSESWSNGMVEGFVNKVKWIKRSSYGQAGFPLLQRRVLLHPATRKPVGTDRRRRSSRKSASAAHDDASGANSPPTVGAAA